MFTFTSGSTVVAPDNVDGYEASRGARTKVHNVLGRVDPDITLRPAGLRTGTLTLGFIGESDAFDAHTQFSKGVVWTFYTDERPITFSFVVPDGGTISLRLDDATRDLWFISLPFSEVIA